MVAFLTVFALCVVVGAILVKREAEYHAAWNEYAAVQSAYGAQVTAMPPQTEPTVQSGEIGETVSAVFTSPSSASASEPSLPMALPTSFNSPKVAGLKTENRDTVGWLNILDTKMQYPVVQGADNEYYVTHTFKKKRNASGAIFLDSWNAQDFTDFNTVIYGHNMKDGSMFSDLREYRHQKFFDEHPYIEITLEDRQLLYRVFAAYMSKGEDNGDFRGQGCVTELDRSAFILAARKRSANIASSLTVSRHDRLLTLVTCAGGAQTWYWVVHAVLIEEQL